MCWVSLWHYGLHGKISNILPLTHILILILPLSPHLHFVFVIDVTFASSFLVHALHKKYSEYSKHHEHKTRTIINMQKTAEHQQLRENINKYPFIFTVFYFPF